MLEAEVEKGVAAGAVASIKAHDSKRFRLRAVSHEAEIYQRYFHKSIAKKVSWAQLFLGGFVLLAQVVVMLMLMDYYEFYTSGANIGAGIWSSVVVIIASIMTLWACHKPTYGKLHTSMGLHIITLFVQIIFTFLVFGVGLPELRRSIRLLYRGEYFNLYDRYDRYNYNSNFYPHEYYDGVRGTNETDSINNGTEIRGYAYHGGEIRYKNLLEEKDHLLNLLNVAFVLNSMMALSGISQLLMSFFMSLKTGRAICCGRTHMEGKFLEMEAVGREDADAIVNFRVGAKEKQRGSLSYKSTPRHDSLGPPPSYIPELFSPASNGDGHPNSHHQSFTA